MHTGFLNSWKNIKKITWEWHWIYLLSTQGGWRWLTGANNYWWWKLDPFLQANNKICEQGLKKKWKMWRENWRMSSLVGRASITTHRQGWQRSDKVLSPVTSEWQSWVLSLLCRHLSRCRQRSESIIKVTKIFRACAVYTTSPFATCWS